MTDALEQNDGTVSTGGRIVTNLHFPDDIDGLAGEEELPKLVEFSDKAFTAYSMEMSAEKTRLVKKNTRDNNKEIKVNGQKLETVTSFKYVGSVVFDTPEGKPRMSDVSPLSEISGLSFDSTLLSPLLFFCLVQLPFLSDLFLPAGPLDDVTSPLVAWYLYEMHSILR